MTTSIQRLARERQRATGERYTTALAHVRSQHGREDVMSNEPETPTAATTASPEPRPSRLQRLAQNQRVNHAKQISQKRALVDRVADRLDNELVPVLRALPPDLEDPDARVLSDENGMPICSYGTCGAVEHQDTPYAHLLDNTDDLVFENDVAVEVNRQTGKVDREQMMQIPWRGLRELDSILNDLEDQAPAPDDIGFVTPRMLRRATRCGLVTDNQFRGLGAESIEPGATATLTWESDCAGWLQYPVLDSGVTDGVQVTSMGVSGLPVDIGPDGPIPMARFLASAENPIRLGRRFILVGHKVEIYVHNASAETITVAGALVVAVLNPYVAQQMMERVLTRAARRQPVSIEQALRMAVLNVESMDDDLAGVGDEDDAPDFLDELIADGEARSPGFAADVEKLYEARVSKRSRAADALIELMAQHDVEQAHDAEQPSIGRRERRLRERLAMPDVPCCTAHAKPDSGCSVCRAYWDAMVG